MNEERIDLQDTKVHKLDGSPHIDMILLPGQKERPSRSKDFEWDK